MHSSSLVRSFFVALALFGSFATLASAQRRGRERDVPPDAVVEWTLFVSAHGDRAALRTVANQEPGSIDVGMPGWQCTYSAPNRAQISATNWSEMRTLECRYGDATVSTTGFCQIAGPSWGARAGLLALGTNASTSRVSVTLDCAVRN